MSALKDEHIQESLEQRATEWFVRHRERELAPEEHREFMQWLRASPRHVEAYLSVLGMTSKLPHALDGLNLDAEVLAQAVRDRAHPPEQALFGEERDRLAPRHRERRRNFALAASLIAAVAVALVAGGYWAWPRWMQPSPIVVPADQQRMLALDDGSSVQINSNSRLAVRYSATQRLLELSEGQALFNVAHDARRPFIVRSGGLDVVALGTRFDVSHQSHQVRVTVVEGKIEIVGDGPDTRLKPVRLGAGEQVWIENGAHVARPVAVDAHVATAWARKEVSFAGQRLEEVAAQFNRNAGVHIEIQDEQLKDYRISGVFQAYDLDSFVAYLRQFEGIQVQREGGDVRVLKSDLKSSWKNR